MCLSQSLIQHLRATSHSAIYSCAMSPPVTQQVIATMRVIMGQDGTHEGQLLTVDHVFCPTLSIR